MRPSAANWTICEHDCPHNQPMFHNISPGSQLSHAVAMLIIVTTKNECFLSIIHTKTLTFLEFYAVKC